jgi:putative tricarboxylic transport membrane protein
MTPTRRAALGDLALCAAVAVGAATLLIGASTLPPPRFDPLGSAALPRALAVIMLALGGWIAVRAVLRLLRPGADPVAAPPTAERTHNPLKGVIVFAALVAYIAALDMGRAPLVPATGVFVAVVGAAISGPSLRALLVYGLFGLALAAGLSWVMSNFLYVSFN